MGQALKVWFDTFNWVIAYSSEDAIKVHEEHTGDIWEFDNEEFVLWDKPEHTIFYDYAPNDLPEGAAIEKCRPEGLEFFGQWKVKASTQAWIKHIGRGFLGCADW